MLVVEDIKALQDCLKQSNGKTIGFVPTMGALHRGHVRLVELAKQKCDIVVCSIFVNPVQFNKESDFVNYPNTFNEDIKMLEDAQCDLVFSPSAKEMYPSEPKTGIDFGSLGEVMEGEHRPGHFRGVGIVIERFFELINPDFAYFGEKDFQQLAVIKFLTKKLNLKTKIVGVPTVREKSGLAMSSRNLRLSEAEKAAAAAISEALKYVSENKKNHSIEELAEYFKLTINQKEHLELEYFEIADMTTLKPIKNWTDSVSAVACTAVIVGPVRLIDNMTIIN